MNEQHFLKEILANPEDEVTRQAYADWLLERGDDESAVRGEFIQLQVLLARHAGGGSPAEWTDVRRLPELKKRERELIDANGKKWAAPLAELVETYQFSRGFVESIGVEPAAFVKHAEHLFAHAPIQRVRLTRALTQAVVDSPALGRVVELDLSNNQMGDPGMRRLVHSSHLGSLRRLILANCYLTDRAMTDLAGSPLLAQLETLHLGNNYIGLPGIQALFASRHWGKLRNLNLTNNYYIDSRAQQYIAQTLAGTADPALLRVMLQTASREQREYTSAPVRDLAQRAGHDPASAPRVLAEGLNDGNRKIRSAAAQMLAQLGSNAAISVPRLVQHLFEDTKLVRDHAAPALARILPELSAPMQRWLCILANPLVPARVNLRAAVDHPDLPPTIVSSFADLLSRRLLWWQRLLEGNEPAEPIVAVAQTKWLQSSSTKAIHCAGLHTARHHSGLARDRQKTRGEDREAAWLVARLVEMLQAEYPVVVAEPAKAAKGPAARRGRWK